MFPINNLPHFNLKYLSKNLLFCSLEINSFKTIPKPNKFSTYINILTIIANCGTLSTQNNNFWQELIRNNQKQKSNTFFWKQVKLKRGQIGDQIQKQAFLCFFKDFSQRFNKFKRNKYKKSIKLMGIFDLNQGINKRQFSKELGIILENSCVSCFRFFDQKVLTPFQAYPCQHVYCKQCVDQLFPKGKLKAECKDCKIEILRSNVKESKMILKVLRIFNQIRSEQKSLGRQQLETKIAQKLQKEDGKYFYSCPKCKQPYDRLEKLPNLVCQNQHLLCSECVKKSHRFNNCFRCDEEYLKEIFTNKLIINASEFIHKKLYCQTVKIVVNEKQFTVVTNSSCTIKDIFHSLQEFDHISNKLEIKLCKFQVEKFYNYSVKREQIKFTEKIGEGKIKKIFLKFDEAALIIGGNVTMSSKFVRELPIKINSFEQERSPKLVIIEEEEFGPQFLNTSSKLQPKIPEESFKLKEKESMRSKKKIFQSTIRQESLKYSQEQSINNQRYNFYARSSQGRSQEAPQYKPEKSEVSESKLKLLDKFRLLEQKKESEKYYFKKSSIIRKKQDPIGTQINSKFIENINTKLGLEERQKILPLFLNKHEVSEANQKYLCYEVYKAMNMPFTRKEIDISLQMQKEIEQKAKKGDLLSLILYVKKKELEDGQIKVIYNPKSSIRSQLTLKILTSHLLTDRFMVTQKMEEDQEFFFQKMNEKQEVFRKFIEKQTLKYYNKFGLNKQNLVIHDLVKGSSILTFSTNQGDQLCKYLKNNLNRDIQIHPYFTQLQLSPEDFDSKGNFEFPQKKKDIQFRANWPYYQPIKSVRHGIKVQGKFDNGDNVWLKMNNVKGEWAVGFHGVRNPNQAYKHFKNVILSILNGLHQADKSMFIVVENSRQAYSSDDCVNKKGEKLGDGVYLSPMFAETLPYTTPQVVGEKSYHLVFQCRLNPKEIRIPRGKQEYWIVRHPAAIRPYGIVLIETTNRRNYPSAIAQFGEIFSYAKYKDRIEAVK